MNDKRPEEQIEWTQANIDSAVSGMVNGFRVAVSESRLMQCPGGERQIMMALLSTAAVFAISTGISRHDFFDAAKVTFDGLMELRKAPGS